ncbi:hypothetical protein M8C21_004484 [Ambrosia artemisiifolia]|uniref:Uncharacterized protein n=1 Tax=Ambrosia artemisiifolia TaxID=4212 RepID=A0AAD5DBJ1_AMBAR|nr:hypothetical protein M8C21_004484 [Ambrosia artemisiifolia]
MLFGEVKHGAVMYAEGLFYAEGRTIEKQHKQPINWMFKNLVSLFAVLLSRHDQRLENKRYMLLLAEFIINWPTARVRRGDHGDGGLLC